jgi:hypothetical protein
MRHDLPWMSQDLGQVTMLVIRSEFSGDPERRIEVRIQTHRRDVVAGTVSKDIKGSFDYVEDHRRLGDCPSNLRLMSLREIWQSTLQWGF